MFYFILACTITLLFVHGTLFKEVGSHWIANIMQMYFPKKPHLPSRVREETGGRHHQRHLRSFPQTPGFSLSGSFFMLIHFKLSQNEFETSSVDTNNVFLLRNVFVTQHAILSLGQSWREGDCWCRLGQTGCSGTGFQLVCASNIYGE